MTPDAPESLGLQEVSTHVEKSFLEHSRILGMAIWGFSAEGVDRVGGDGMGFGLGWELPVNQFIAGLAGKVLDLS